MNRYKVGLHIKNTGAMSLEDFKRLREAVDTISEVTDFKMVIDKEGMTVASMATMMQLLPESAFKVQDTKDRFRNKRESRKLAHECPVVTCKHGLVKDAKTGKLRDCVVCHGTSKLKPKP